MKKMPNNDNYYSLFFNETMMKVGGSGCSDVLYV